MTKPSTQQSLGYDSNAGVSTRTSSTSGFSLVIVVVAVVVLTVLAFAAWRLWDSNQKDQGIVAEPSLCCILYS